MKIPLGDIIRALAKPGSWLQKIFSKTKGITIDLGGHQIGLDEKHGPAAPGTSKFDSKPHQPGT